MAYEEDRALQKFDNLRKVGEGTYGQVFAGVHRSTQRKIALKRIPLDKDQEGIPSTCLREIALLKQLNHQNIVKLYDVICTDSRLFLVFEFVDRDLKALLDRLPDKKLPPRHVKSFVWQLLMALAYCHTRRIIHRDLKPQNLLVEDSGIIKLADFGLAREISIPSRVYTHEVVTLWYRPPEVLMGGKYYTSALDMWSLGCIFFEMAAGQPLFAGDSEIDQLFKIFRLFGTPSSKFWPGVEKLPDYKEAFPKWKRDKTSMDDRMSEMDSDAQELALQMLVYAPQDRVTAKTSLSHRYITRHGMLPFPTVSSLFSSRSQNESVNTSLDPRSPNYGHSPINDDESLFGND